LLQGAREAPAGHPGVLASMARLPLVEDPLADRREWLEPADIREAFRIQRRFVLPDHTSLRWTLLATIGPGGLFLRCVLPRAASLGQASLCTSCSRGAVSLWALGALLGLAAASFRNPGVVPRAPAVASGCLSEAPPRYITVNGVLLRQRWCSTCRVYRPLRSKHCSYCDRCVFRFDHHCTWIGNCVGLGNYRSFLLLVVAAALFFGHSALITLKVLRYNMREDSGSLAEARGRGPEEVEFADESGPSEVLRMLFIANGGKVLYIVYAVILCFAFMVLIMYHAIIIACNMTTNEHVRDYYLNRNPFDITCVDNYRMAFCAPYGRALPIGAYPPMQPAGAEGGDGVGDSP